MCVGLVWGQEAGRVDARFVASPCFLLPVLRSTLRLREVLMAHAVFGYFFLSPPPLFGTRPAKERYAMRCDAARDISTSEHPGAARQKPGGTDRVGRESRGASTLHPLLFCLQASL